MKQLKNLGQSAFTAITGIAIALFILTFAIAVPILLRPYYYWNIDLLDLEEATGYSREEITEGFDNVMDYLVNGSEFSTSPFPHTEAGKAHFEDCRKLFIADFAILGITSAYLLIIFILRLLGKIKKSNKKFTPSFYSATGMLAVFGILGIWGISDFDSLFNAFHALFFPGKDNWVFSMVYDPIVNILPPELWMNYALLIGAIIAAFLAAIFILHFVRKKKLAKARLNVTNAIESETSDNC